MGEGGCLVRCVKRKETHAHTCVYVCVRVRGCVCVCGTFLAGSAVVTSAYANGHIHIEQDTI